MDTTFWGPDGWKLLHHIAYFYPDNPSKKDKKIFKLFYENVSLILPCKYCRISNAKYMKSLPLIQYLNSRDELTQWIFKMHNKVNNKLRKQGYCIYKNPSYAEINDKYEKSKQILLKKGMGKDMLKLLICNNFIGSIIFNYPNYLKNCKVNMTPVELQKLYNNFLKSLIDVYNYIEIDTSLQIRLYLKKKPLSKVLYLPGNYQLNKCKINLYKWYFDLCHFVYNSKSLNDKEKDYIVNLNTKILNINNFCKKFTKYVVKACTEEKIKLNNTCRKLTKKK
tara:strand:- start:1085 stop:1921 length:837 start_codon:yes stop_codon:yes gene_type:complete